MGVEDKWQGQNQMAASLECQGIGCMDEKHEKLQKSVLTGGNFLLRTVHTMQSLSPFKRPRGLVRMKIIDMSEHVLCKGRHYSHLSMQLLAPFSHL